MRDIFAKKPAAQGTPNVPSLRYDLFIKAFEREVIARQSQIKAIEAMEQPYNLVKEALEAVRLPNDCQLRLAHGVVLVQITAVPTDRLAMFEALTERVGAALLKAGLHRDGVPSVGDAGYWPERKWTWKLGGQRVTGTVAVAVDLPRDGIADIEVTQIRRTTESIEWLIGPRDDAAARAPERVEVPR